MQDPQLLDYASPQPGLRRPHPMSVKRRGVVAILAAAELLIALTSLRILMSVDWAFSSFAAIVTLTATSLIVGILLLLRAISRSEELRISLSCVVIVIVGVGAASLLRKQSLSLGLMIATMGIAGAVVSASGDRARSAV